MSAFYPKLRLELLTNAKVHCCKIIKFRQSFTSLHLATHYQGLNVASILSQKLSYYNTESRSTSKQSRLLENMREIYALNNMHALFQETELLGQRSSNRKQSNAELRFEVSLL